MTSISGNTASGIGIGAGVNALPKGSLPQVKSVRTPEAAPPPRPLPRANAAAPDDLRRTHERVQHLRRSVEHLDDLIGDNPVATLNAEDMGDAMARIRRDMNDLFASQTTVPEVINDLAVSFTEAFGEAWGGQGPDYNPGYGLRVDFGNAGEATTQVMPFTTVDQRNFEDGVTDDSERIRDLLDDNPASDDGGLLETLSSQLRGWESYLRGTMLDRSVGVDVTG